MIIFGYWRGVSGVSDEEAWIGNRSIAINHAVSAGAFRVATSGSWRTLTLLYQQRNQFLLLLPQPPLRPQRHPTARAVTMTVTTAHQR
ncbi:hypothetical protein LSM04_005726 [Trypanosoma melophagium]|uniref:uncharacterized protein n=1 Tax=Trypanosoma melophagium TaxID=715481 RepID=UPI00351A71A9|nr:hypothetical protein LSM04_005726 [Trypanosoma melophagium]